MRKQTSRVCALKERRRHMSSKNHPYEFFWEAASAYNAAAFTIAMRMTSFAFHVADGRTSVHPEATRMVDEKVQAAVDGWREASRTAAAEMGKAAVGAPAPMAGPAIAMAAMRPGFDRARRNARRLSRRR